MIQLTIDGQPVATSPDLALEIYYYNPVLDRQGHRNSFTFDIDLDLHQSGNARLYRHFNRINSTSVFTGRTARLTVDGRVLIEGMEVVLKVEGHLVKIQVVEGNSMAINPLGSKARMRDLNMGELPGCTDEEALSTLTAEPLSVPAVYSPLLVEDDELPVLREDMNTDTKNRVANLVDYSDLWQDAPQEFYDNGRARVPLPYLVVVIERALEALGWTVTYNVLRHTEFARRLIVVHGYDTTRLCEMVPNWTVDEFLEQVQKFFDVSFINTTGRSLEIRSTNDVVTDTLPVVIEVNQVISDNASPAREYADTADEDYVTHYTSVRYALPSKPWGCWADLSDNLKDLVSIQLCTSIPQLTEKSEYRYARDLYNQPILFRHWISDTLWMLKQTGESLFPYMLVRVDAFAHVGDEDDAVELKITPACCRVVALHTGESQGGGLIVCGIVLPVTDYVGNFEIDTTTTSQHGLTQWVEGEPPSVLDTSGNTLQVAQFLGYTTVLSETHHDAFDSLHTLYDTARYPQCYTHRYTHAALYDHDFDPDFHSRGVVLDALWDKREMESDISFSLSRLTSPLASSNLIDDNEVHTIHFRTDRPLDVRSVFLIAGRRFACVSLMYQVEGGHLSQKVIGKFLPLK